MIKEIVRKTIRSQALLSLCGASLRQKSQRAKKETGQHRSNWLSMAFSCGVPDPSCFPLLADRPSRIGPPGSAQTTLSDLLIVPRLGPLKRREGKFEAFANQMVQMLGSGYCQPDSVDGTHVFLPALGEVLAMPGIPRR